MVLKLGSTPSVKVIATCWGRHGDRAAHRWVGAAQESVGEGRWCAEEEQRGGEREESHGVSPSEIEQRLAEGVREQIVDGQRAGEDARAGNGAGMRLPGAQGWQAGGKRCCGMQT